MSDLYNFLASGLNGLGFDICHYDVGIFQLQMTYYYRRRVYSCNVMICLSDCVLRCSVWSNIFDEFSCDMRDPSFDLIDVVWWIFAVGFLSYV